MQESQLSDKELLEDAVVIYNLKTPPRETSTGEQIEITVEDREPTIEEVELAAAKQLLLELKMIKNRIYQSGTLVNSVLIVQVKGILRGLIKKYNEFGLFEGENITLRLSNRSKHANIDFVYSQKLQLLMERVVAELPKPGVDPIQPINESNNVVHRA